MNWLNRQSVCKLLRISSQQTYRIFVSVGYGKLISSIDIIEKLNLARNGMPVITGEDAFNIPSDLLNADELMRESEIAGSDITPRDILNWSNRSRNPLPHYRLNKRIRLYRMRDVSIWLNGRKSA